MKYRLIMHYPDGTNEEIDNIFDTESEAEEHGGYFCSCYRSGGETLHLSNPGDYPLDEDAVVDFEVIEVDS